MLGRLPVRVLMDRMLVRYENIAHGFFEEVLDEIRYRDFRPEIICISARDPIHNPCIIKEHPVIGTNKKVYAIEIEESFLHFIWCIAFSTHIIYQECFAQPVLRGEKPKPINPEEELTIQAIRVSEAGSSLLKNVDWEKFYSLPNPEHPIKGYEGMIEVANQLFFVAASFILLHEMGHQFLGHLRNIHQADFKNEELNADDYAVHWISRELGNNSLNDELLHTGTMVAMLSLLLLHRDLNGGPEHPHPDQRILRILEHLKLNDNHPTWMFGTLGLPVWIATHGSVQLNVESWTGHFKDLFMLSLQQLVESRRSN